jgi:amino acid transporter, AAT family
LSFYIEIPIMFVMTVAWLVLHRRAADGSTTPILAESLPQLRSGPWWKGDVVDTEIVDLRRDEYAEGEEEREEDEERKRRLSGRARWLWRTYYWFA